MSSCDPNTFSLSNCKAVLPLTEMWMNMGEMIFLFCFVFVWGMGGGDIAVAVG